jgi:hypothetical protein
MIFRSVRKFQPDAEGWSAASAVLEGKAMLPHQFRRSGFTVGEARYDPAAGFGCLSGQASTPPLDTEGLGLSLNGASSVSMLGC